MRDKTKNVISTEMLEKMSAKTLARRAKVIYIQMNEEKISRIDISKLREARRILEKRKDFCHNISFLLAGFALASLMRLSSDNVNVTLTSGIVAWGAAIGCLNIEKRFESKSTLLDNIYKEKVQYIIDIGKIIDGINDYTKQKHVNADVDTVIV